jgi:hypothetical protein
MSSCSSFFLSNVPGSAFGGGRIGFDWLCFWPVQTAVTLVSRSSTRPYADRPSGEIGFVPQNGGSFRLPLLVYKGDADLSEAIVSKSRAIACPPRSERLYYSVARVLLMSNKKWNFVKISFGLRCGFGRAMKIEPGGGEKRENVRFVQFCEIPGKSEQKMGGFWAEAGLCALFTW